MNGNRTSEILRLKKIKGQIEGVEKMCNDNRYCIDIVQQIRAIAAALKSLEREILRAHLNSCIHQALQTKNSTEIQGKFNEVLGLLK